MIFMNDFYQPCSKLQNLATGLLYASLYFQTCGILTSESANVSDFSHVSFLQLANIESVTSH